MRKVSSYKRNHVSISMFEQERAVKWNGMVLFEVLFVKVYDPDYMQHGVAVKNVVAFDKGLDTRMEFPVNTIWVCDEVGL